MGIFDDGRNGAVVDVEAFLDSGIPKRVARLVSLGLLVAIGSTRDRGAVSIQLTHDGDWTREYFRRPDEAEDWLDHWIGKLDTSPVGTTGEATSTQKPRRGRRMAT